MALNVNANIGSVSMKEAPVLAGKGPHVIRTEKLLAGQAELDPALVVALDADDQVVPYDAAQSLVAATGDGTSKTFTTTLGEVEPGSVAVTDGTEAFSDDGFGNLTGDATGIGKVNYQTGAVSVTFNAAPTNGGDVDASYKPVMRGALVRKAETDAGVCDVCIHGKVIRTELKVGSADITAVQIKKLERLGIWAI
jgi:hypothetical protein